MNKISSMPPNKTQENEFLKIKHEFWCKQHLVLIVLGLFNYYQQLRYTTISFVDHFANIFQYFSIPNSGYSG